MCCEKRRLFTLATAVPEVVLPVSKTKVSRVTDSVAVLILFVKSGIEGRRQFNVDHILPKINLSLTNFAATMLIIFFKNLHYRRGFFCGV